MQRRDLRENTHALGHNLARVVDEQLARFEFNRTFSPRLGPQDFTAEHFPEGLAAAPDFLFDRPPWATFNIRNRLA